VTEQETLENAGSDDENEESIEVINILEKA
jgi:hypothetical protein